MKYKLINVRSVLLMVFIILFHPIVVKAAVSYSSSTSSLPSMASSCANRMIFGDFNNDGYIDVLYQNSTTSGSNIYYQPGEANGSFGAAIAASSAGTFSDGPFNGITFTYVNVMGAGQANLKVVDYDNDGDSDLVETNSGGATRLLKNDNGVFTEDTANESTLPSMATSCSCRMIFGDFNNDGYIDVLYQNSITSGSNIYYQPGVGNGSFGAAIAASSGPFNGITFTNISTNGSGIANIKVVDYDNDGDSDLVETNSGGATRLLKNNNGVFAEDATNESTLPAMATSCASRMIFGDFNSDGYIDALYQNSTTSGSNIYYQPGVGNGSFGTAIVASSSGTFSDGPFNGMTFTHANTIGASQANLRVVDYDNDGDSDLIEANSAAATRSITQSNSPPKISTSTPLDNSVDFSPTGSIILNFDQTIGSADLGNIIIKKVSDDSVVATIAANDSKVTGIGTSTITINSGVTLAENTQYYILIDKRAFFNSDGQTFMGIKDKTKLNFTTGSLPVTVLTAASNGIATATGTTTITLGQAITGLTANDIVVTKDGAALVSGADYTLGALTGTTFDITFTASAALNNASVVTIEMTKASYEINSGNPIAVANTIPAPATLSSIAVKTPATKLSYTVGDALDITGLVIEGTYSDASKQNETITATNVTGFNSSAAVASQSLTVTVGGKTTTYTVEIKAALATLSSIAVKTPATKLSYTVGDALDITGLVIEGTYSDASKQNETITAANISGFNSSAAVASQSLTVTVGGKTTTYTVEIKAAQATLSSIAVKTPATKLSYTVGDALDITGLVIEGTYSDASKQNETITAANVTGFNSSAAVASQSLTVTVGGKTTTYTVEIKAAPATLSSIAVKTPATKLSYTVGDALDITGLVIEGTYSDASKQNETITAANVTGFNSSAAVASQSLTVTVGGKTTTYTVEIKAAPATLSSIAVKTPATKLSYTVGDALDITGLVIEGTYSDASKQNETITAANISGFNSSAAVASQSLTVTVGSKTTTYTVEIKAAPATLSSIAVKTPATKLSYTVGDALDITGLVIEGTYSDASKQNETITAANISGFNSSAAVASQSLTVTVGGKTTTYTVEIKAAPATLSSIAVKTPATKLSYTVGDALDITGLVIEGTYSDASKQNETITAANVTGFNSSAAVASQSLTVTVGGKTTTYTVEIKAATTVLLTSDSQGTAGDSKVTGLTSGLKYQVGIGGTLKYVKENGTLSTSKLDLGDLIGTEITGLTNGEIYNVQEYTTTSAVTVVLDSGSLGTAGDECITGLTAGNKYKVIVNGVTEYVKSDGTLSTIESEAGILSGTEIVGLTNGITYKVEQYTTSSSSGKKHHSSTGGSGGSLATGKITVNITDGSSDKSVSQTEMERTTSSNGNKTDTVNYTADKAKETVKTLASQGKDVVRIVATDADETVTETKVNIFKDTLSVLSSANINLEIETNGAIVSVPKESVQGLAESEQLNGDLYFRVVPIKDEAKQKEIKITASNEAEIKAASGNNEIQVLGTPMTIQTNMSKGNVDIILPLTGVTLPADASEREAFFNDLGVFVEHSDGEKVFQRGTIVEYKPGFFGIKFTVTKFSDFTIVKLNKPSIQPGWTFKDGYWYFVENDGTMAKGWHKANSGEWTYDGKDTVDTWFHLKSDGKMDIGWFKDTDGTWYFLKDNGVMTTNWQQINGVWYYFNSNGSMAANTTIDGYILDENGAWEM